MKKLTLTKSLEIARAQIQSQRVILERQHQELKEKDITIKHLSQIANAFDRLLDGVCAGMKEANFPRRAH